MERIRQVTPGASDPSRGRWSALQDPPHLQLAVRSSAEARADRRCGRASLRPPAGDARASASAEDPTP
jgi:hypothetical protein